MILLPLLLLVVLAALAAAGIGRLVLGNPDRRRSATSLTPLVVVGIGVGAVVLLVVAPIMVLGLRGGGDHGSAPERATATTVAAPADVLAPAERAVSSDVLGPVVRVSAGSDDAAVGGVRSDTVVRMRVSGFEPFTSATARQCVAERCGNEVAVQLDEQGESAFQYLVVDDFAPGAQTGGCRRDAPPCSIVIEDVEREARAALTTVFVDELPPPARIQVEPATGLVDGSVLEVTVDGVASGATVEVLLCARTAVRGGQPCDAPAAAVSVTARRDGVARAVLAVDRRPSCADERGCVVAARSRDAVLRAPVAALDFARPPGVDYDGRRLLAGLGTAAVLAAVAIALIRRSDWSAIGEEAAPEIDDAEYADLDAIIAALPPEEGEELLV